jgi:hypothetical protein
MKCLPSFSMQIFVLVLAKSLDVEILSTTYHRASISQCVCCALSVSMPPWNSKNAFYLFICLPLLADDVMGMVIKGLDIPSILYGQAIRHVVRFWPKMFALTSSRRSKISQYLLDPWLSLWRADQKFLIWHLMSGFCCPDPWVWLYISPKKCCFATI